MNIFKCNTPNFPKIATFFVANHLSAHSMMFGAKKFFSDFGNFLCLQCPKFKQKFSTFSTFWVAIHFSAHSMMFGAKKLFPDLGNFLCPTPQILTKTFKNFDFYGCKTFFGPFYDVLSKKMFLSYKSKNTKMLNFIWKNDFKPPIFKHVPRYSPRETVF